MFGSSFFLKCVGVLTCVNVFQAGESINLVGWRKIDFSEAMYAAHLYILKLVAMKHDAAF